jgi:hypothetical protein
VSLHLAELEIWREALKMGIRTAKVGLAFVALSTVSFVASGFGGSPASAALRASESKMCKQYIADIEKTNFTPQQQVASYRKLSGLAPGGLKSELATLARETAAADNGGATKSQKKSVEKLFKKIESQLTTDCAK